MHVTTIISSDQSISPMTSFRATTTTTYATNVPITKTQLALSRTHDLARSPRLPVFPCLIFFFVFCLFACVALTRA